MKPTLSAKKKESAAGVETDRATMLLAFGLGFSYQLGLEEDVMSKNNAILDQGIGPGPVAPSLGPPNGDDAAGVPSSWGDTACGERICASVVPFPTPVPMDRFMKKGDAPAYAAAGANHSVLLTREGKLFRWGVEDGDIFRFPTPVCTQIPLPCIQVCCGRKHTTALMNGGFVMTWGTGYFGQLGHGDNASYRHPKLLRRLDPQRLGERVTQIACGGYHSAVVTDAGMVFTWGFNRYGQCGNGSKDNTVPEPALVDLSNIPAGGLGSSPKILCGRHHTALLAGWGALYTWGASSFGKLGLADPEKTVCIPQEVTFFSDKPLLQADAGDFHMVALSRRREVFSWGFGAEGQGGHGSLLHMRTPRRVNSLQDVPIAQVVCGSWWSMAITVDGYCYSWGCADGGWTGLALPKGLSVVDPGPANDRAVETQSFDSTHNVHVPELVYSLAPYRVLQLGCGGGHSLVVAAPRAPSMLSGPEAAGTLGLGMFSPPMVSPPASTAAAVAAAAAAAAAGNMSAFSSSTSTVSTAVSSSSASTTASLNQTRRSPPTVPMVPGVSSWASASTGGASEWESAVTADAAVAANSGVTGTVQTSMSSTSTAVPAGVLTPRKNVASVRRDSKSGANGGGRYARGGRETEESSCSETSKSPPRPPEFGGPTESAGGERLLPFLGGDGINAGRGDGFLPPVEKKRLPELVEGPSKASGAVDVELRSIRSGADGAATENDVHRVHWSSVEREHTAENAPTVATAAGKATRYGGTDEARGVLPVLGDPHANEQGNGVARESHRFHGAGGGVIDATGVMPAEEQRQQTLGRDAGAAGRLAEGGRGMRASSPLLTSRLEDLTSAEYEAKVFSYCRHGRLEEVQAALAGGFDVCGQRDENGNTLLHCAAQNGLRSMCKALLQDGKGSPLNLKNNGGNTALHYAFAFGFHQLGKYLIVNGADDALVNDQGLTCYEGLDRSDVELLS